MHADMHARTCTHSSIQALRVTAEMTLVKNGTCFNPSSLCFPADGLFLSARSPLSVYVCVGSRDKRPGFSHVPTLLFRLCASLVWHCIGQI